MLSNAYFVAKIRFDTPEIEPVKNLQNFRKMHFSKIHFSNIHFSKMQPSYRRRSASPRGKPRSASALPTLLSCHGIRQTLEGSFSAVSKPNFASKYAFESSRRDLHNALLCTAPKSHFFKKLVEFAKICENFQKFCEIRNFSNRFFAKILRLQRCKRMQIL